MSNALHQDLDWFWYYWLFTTERVDESIQSVSTVGGRTSVTVRQDGEMPSPVVLKVELARDGSGTTPAPSTRVVRPGVTESTRWLDANTAIVSYPVDIWFNGSRTFVADLDFQNRVVVNLVNRPITRITLDPYARFPDRNPRDNVWPRAQ
jgi:hypothetical protein